MFFADIHSHALYAVDDGPETEEKMYETVAASYRDGIRHLCLTPHFHPGFYGNNQKKTEAAFQKLLAHCSANYPDLKLYLGNELHYSPDCISWLFDGHCRTLNQTRYVLVDFSHKVSKKELSYGLENLLRNGYLPILAHAERYQNASVKLLEELKQNGVLLQLNAQAILGEFGFSQKQKTKKILSKELADFVASDAHDFKYRTSKMTQCYEYLLKKYSASYADFLCRDNALEQLLNVTSERKSYGSANKN